MAVTAFILRVLEVCKMAQFFGEIKGKTKTIASREGSKISGIWSHIRGWDIGVEVSCYFDEESGKDVINIYETGGSNNPSRKKLLVTLKG